MHSRFIAAFTKETAGTPGDQKIWERGQGFLTAYIYHGKTYYVSYETVIGDDQYRPKSNHKVVPDRRLAVRFDATTSEFLFPQEFNKRHSCPPEPQTARVELHSSEDRSSDDEDDNAYRLLRPYRFV